MPKRSFTLVEMLVVVAIIAVLAALLMPALHSALGQARTTACVNNIRQLNLAHAAYIEDWNGHIVWHRNADPFWKHFASQLWPYATGTPYDFGIYARSPIFWCNANKGYPDGWGMNLFVSGVKLSRVRSPGRKVFVTDAKSDAFMAGSQFTRDLGGSSYGYALRHVGELAAVAFLDGTARALGVPPLPLTTIEGDKWLVPSSPGPSNF